MGVRTGGCGPQEREGWVDDTLPLSKLCNQNARIVWKVLRDSFGRRVHVLARPGGGMFRIEISD